MTGKAEALVLSGFLGSGKTTVLMRLLEHVRGARGDGYRIAIIENEVGSASVDSSIVREAGYSVTEMLSGCICCTLIGELVPAVRKLCDEVDPDLLILEATGVASPHKMRDNIQRHAGLPTRIVTVVDAARWEGIREALKVLLESQVGPADAICMSKVDLVDGDQAAAVEESVRSMNADAPIVCMNATTPVEHAQLDTLLGWNRQADDGDRPSGCSR